MFQSYLRSSTPQKSRRRSRVLALGIALGGLIPAAFTSGCTESSGALCGTNQTLCGTICVDMRSDNANCGQCGQICGGATPYCSNSACSASCAADQLQCATGCVSPMVDPSNCGNCGVACMPGTSCQLGACTAVSGSGGAGPGGTGGAPGAGGLPGAGGGLPGAGGGLPGAGGGLPGAGGSDPNPGSGGGGGTVNPGNDPPGYYRTGTFKGCAWTGVDDTDAGTTIAPSDFTARAAADPFCAAGSVGAHEEYESVALLGFNLNEDPATADCTYDPNSAQEQGPPGVQLGETGIAANIVKQGSDTTFTFRVQIQGPDGATDDTQRWCATITATQGKIFVPYEDFNTECWDGGGADYAGEPISAVVFLVPGEPTALPFDFCVNGFAVGNSAEDAPDGPAQAGDQTGTVGAANVQDGDFRRAKVLVDGEEYIIQNNNWGNPGGSDLILDYFNNSFTITEGNGSSPGGGVPASFPSIYIGANGETANGVLATSGTDNLPRQISQISSAQTSFRWSGSTGSFNATYDIWFANSPPTTQYEDGIDGFIMIWVHDPADAQPIGSSQGSFSHGGVTYDVWVGPRGEGPAGPNNAPVVSFVAQGDVHSGAFDLKTFFTEASKYGISSSMYLTDVFFGFEIWNGGAGGNLSVEEFTCKVE